MERETWDKTQDDKRKNISKARKQKTISDISLKIPDQEQVQSKLKSLKTKVSNSIENLKPMDAAQRID